MKYFILALLVSLSSAVAAYEYTPVPKYQSPGGWMFDVMGAELFCRTEGENVVSCVDVNQVQFICVYQDPPQYFSDCKRVQ